MEIGQGRKRNKKVQENRIKNKRKKGVCVSQDKGEKINFEKKGKGKERKVLVDAFFASFFGACPSLTTYIKYLFIVLKNLL